MLKELTAHIDAGETDQQILTHFVEKYGKAVLPAGGAQGILAKVIAFVVVGVGAVVAVFVVKRWKASGARHSASAEPGTGPALDPEYRRRVEEDLKKLTPED